MTICGLGVSRFPLSLKSTARGRTIDPGQSVFPLRVDLSLTSVYAYSLNLTYVHAFLTIIHSIYT